MHQTSHACELWHKFTYFNSFASGHGQMAPQRPLEMVKNSGKISDLTDEDEIWYACRACQDAHICHKDFFCQIDRKPTTSCWIFKIRRFQALEFNELLLGILLDPHENHCVCSWPLWDQKLLKLFHSKLRCGRGMGAILSLSPRKFKCL